MPLPFDPFIYPKVVMLTLKSSRADNVFAAIKRDFPRLVWTVKSDDENLTWFFDKAEGSLSRDGEVLFWTGIESAQDVAAVMQEFGKHGRDVFGDINLENKLQKAARAAANLGGSRQQARAYSTASRPSNFSNALRDVRYRQRRQASRSYATTNPNPPFGSKNASRQDSEPAKVALIGARGYTGKALIELLNRHPHIDLRHVSSRELAGQKLEGYDKRAITYENLSPDDLERLWDGLDCIVMALPNGVAAPWVNVGAGKKNLLVIDLSADYRFDSDWTYGLPELVDRATISQSTRLSNPGCYATAAQLGIAPLLDFLDPNAGPTIVGHSGYSGAGTKPSPKNNIENLANNIIPYSLVRITLPNHSFVEHILMVKTCFICVFHNPLLVSRKAILTETLFQTGHIHEKEISTQLGRSVAFIPHVFSLFQGISHTISIPLNKAMTSRDIRNIFTERYEGEPLVKVIGDVPSVKNISGAHGVEIGGFSVTPDGKRVVIIATIDNLLKGAATQALQNMNLALG